jgi:hypothetical protein
MNGGELVRDVVRALAVAKHVAAELRFVVGREEHEAPSARLEELASLRDRLSQAEELLALLSREPLDGGLLRAFLARVALRRYPLRNHVAWCLYLAGILEEHEIERVRRRPLLDDLVAFVSERRGLVRNGHAPEKGLRLATELLVVLETFPTPADELERLQQAIDLEARNLAEGSAFQIVGMACARARQPLDVWGGELS